MTVAVMKTKAETSLAEQFEALAPKLPGSKTIGALRRTAMARFQELGLPHRRVEAWKYTDLRAALRDVAQAGLPSDAAVSPADVDQALGALAKLDTYRLTFVNGQYDAALSNVKGAAGLEVVSLADILSKAPEAVAEGLARTNAPADEAVVALNAALMTDGAVVRIAAGAKLGKPLMLISLRAGTPARLITTRNVVSAGAKSEAVLVEVHAAAVGAAAGQTNTATEVTVGEGAALTHVKWTEEGAATHLASWVPKLAAGANYRAFLFTFGTALARNQMFLTFAGEGAKIDVSGAFLGRGNEHVDTTLVIDHAVPACESRELYKVVLADQARGVFQGKVIVRPDAQKTDGKQMSQALMLSEEAEFDSKPELEIHADDVVCGHGATSAEIDEDMMFYLASRGIPKDEARALLIEAFIGEVIETVEHEALREALRDAAGGWLKALKM